jgi:Ribonuclease G/E
VAAYPPTEFLADVRKGIWSEVYGDGPVQVDAYRRNLQRSYIETVGDRVNGRTAASDDARAFFRGELKTLDADLKTALTRTTDRATKLHLEDIQNQIAHALDPAIQAAPGAAAVGRPGTAIDDFDVTSAPESCWVDYTIRPRSAGGGR